ncbi:MAG: anthranilate phosphoribosyltransferase [Chloroflexi bacterium]|nr:anthranilate phosphoribosyltransferase [Chloroflexota bacterium]
MIKEAIEAVVVGRSLSMEEAAATMEDIMSGQATPAQIGAFLVALRIKGETAEEIAGMARVMRDKALRVQVDGPAIDIVGTGGDRSGTFNISTAAALLAAACGVKVAKHGNRAMSSACGSADALEALGVPIALGPEGVARLIKETGFGFMFAPNFHPAMRHAAGPRREIGIRTVFNVLGPLTNPAFVPAQATGAAEPGLAEKMIQVLKLLGSRRALVFHSADGLDELSTTAPSHIHELKDGQIGEYHVTPEELGLPRARLADLKGGSPQDNAAMIRAVLSGEKGPRRDVVLLNAAAGLVVAGAAKDLKEGIAIAARAVDSGRAQRKLDEIFSVGQAIVEEGK